MDGQTKSTMTHTPDQLDSKMRPFFNSDVRRQHFLPPSKATMKLALSVLALAATASAFAPASIASRGLTSSVATATPTQLFSEPEDDDEEEGLDLNLEEMFDMYV